MAIKKKDSNIIQHVIFFFNEIVRLNKDNYIYAACLDFSALFSLILHGIAI